MMMQHLRHHESSTSRSSSRDYTSVASSADNADYCRICLANSHHALTCPILSKTTSQRIINQSQINLASLPPGDSCRLGNSSPSHSGKSPPNSSCPGNRTRKRSDGTISETHDPGSESPSTHRSRNYSAWNRGETTFPTGPSVTEIRGVGPTAQTTSIRPRN